jgi:hypothetical protein
MHRLFVDDMAHASTCEKLKKQFLHEYKRDFDITEEDIMSTFLGIELKQTKDLVKLHLDTYIQECWDIRTAQRPQIRGSKRCTNHLWLNCYLQPHVPDVTLHTPQRSLHDFAHLQEHLTGQLGII